MTKLNPEFKEIIPILLFIIIGFWSLQSAAIILFYIICLIIIKILKSDVIHNQTISFNYIDYAILFVLLSEIISYSFSIYRPISLSSLNNTIIITVFYFALRFHLKSTRQIWLIINTVSCYGAILSLITLLFFFVFSFNVSYDGFDNLTEFRNLYKPFGIISNIWVTILLTFLPFTFCGIYIHRKNTYIKYVIIITAVLQLFLIFVSFSRGSYFAMLAFFLVPAITNLLYKPIYFNQLLTFLSIGIISVLLVIVTYEKPFIDTLKLFETVSQKRSFEGRVKVWKFTPEIVRKNPLFGIGANNFALISSKYKSSNDEITSKTVRITNTPLQILIEKGIIGLCAYGMLSISIILALLHKIKKEEHKIIYALFLSGFICVVIKEMSFSSIFDNDGLRLLLIVPIVLATTRVNR